MLHYKTEVLVLKKRDFGEADRLLTCLSKRFGKLILLAKGVRRITSKKASALELLNWSKLAIVKTRNFDLILESELKSSFSGIKNNLYKTSLAYQLAEVTCELTVEYQPVEKLFDLLLKALASLSVESKRLHQKLIVAVFQIKALEILGFYSFEKFASLKLETAHKLSDFLLLPFAELRKLELTKLEVETIYQTAGILVEEVIEKKLKSNEFVRELDSGVRVAI